MRFFFYNPEQISAVGELMSNISLQSLTFIKFELDDYSLRMSIFFKIVVGS